MTIPIGYCLVTFVVKHLNLAVPNAIVTATLEHDSAMDGVLLSKRMNYAVTNNAGTCTLLLVRLGSFTRGDGVYRIRAHDGCGLTFMDRRVTIPNVDGINAEDLPDAPGGA